mmetsp:Transcript_4049/g.7110  ORF Transcript_4049/g.7110 Transcript_4049/m.7110 type:complete len:254 (-) Transcript_4049:196-957(-)
MSSPRAATSVAIRIGTFCCRKSSRAASRAPWPLSPWMAPTFQPARRRSPSSREHSFLYRPKTITRLRPSWYRSSSCCSRAPRSRSPITSTHCETRALAASLDPPIVTRTGRSRNSAASSRTSRGHVAENMAVRRPPAAAPGAGQAPMIARMSCSNPRSSMRSASSRTRYVTRRRFVVPPSRWSINRPGVATTISTPARRSATCARFGTPPYTHVFLMPLLPPNLSHSSLICRASSRVGATTRTIGPSPGCRYG